MNLVNRTLLAVVGDLHFSRILFWSDFYDVYFCLLMLIRVLGLYDMFALIKFGVYFISISIFSAKLTQNEKTLNCH